MLALLFLHGIFYFIFLISLYTVFFSSN